MMELCEHKSSQREHKDVGGPREAAWCDTREGTDALPKHSTQSRATSNFKHTGLLALGKAGIVAAILDMTKGDTEKGSDLP